LQKKILTVAEIAKIVDGEIIGDSELIISQVSPLNIACKEDISFLSNFKFESELNTTQAGCVLLSKGYKKTIENTAIVCRDPYLAFAQIAKVFDSTPLPADNISTLAVIDPSADIGENVNIAAGVVIQKNCKVADNVSIGANCHLGQGVSVAEKTIIYSNVSIYHAVTIGANCILHSGVVIGGDGFGYANDSGKWVKIPQTGSVIIGDDVEIGANSTIDRGALNNTIIGNGVKIDNLCHIAHNVTIGEHSAMAGCSAIGGSTQVGKYCTFGGRSAAIGHLNIADGTHLTAGTIVNKSNQQAGVFSSGTGVQENKVWRKNVARFKQLDEMSKKIRLLEKQVKSLQGDKS